MGMHETPSGSVHLLNPSTSFCSSSPSSASFRRRLPPTPLAAVGGATAPTVRTPQSTPSPTLSPNARLSVTPASPSHLIIQNAFAGRRCSTPRLLPTPPPTSPEIRAASSHLERRPSGRMLPKPPSEDQGQDQGADQIEPLVLPPAPISPSPILIPVPIPILESEIPELTRAEESSPSVEPIGDVEVFEEDSEGVGSSLSPSIEQMMLAPPNLRNSVRRYSINFPLPSDLHSKSASEAEDERRGSRDHGLDPSHYLPGAPIISPNGRSQSISSGHSALGLHNGSTGVAASSSFNGSEGARPSGLGLIHCTMQHFPVRKRLRVNVLKIEGLAGQLKPEMEIHALVKVSIAGLKSGKEQLSEVKRGRDPVFNQEFFFDNVAAEDLDTKSLHIAGYHHGGAKIGKDILIGEVDLALREIRELNTKKEVKFVEELKQTLPKKLGKLYITSCIERDARRLTINLKKADDLPRWGFLGAPDVCIKCTLVQGSGLSKTKCSRILKSTTTAVYNEAVMFIFNPTKIELAHTKITISVHDMQRASTGDDVIGCAYLGILAQDKSEIDQWKSTVDHMGKEVKGTHHLKHPTLNPPVVRVAETVNDDEPEDEEEREEGFEF